MQKRLILEQVSIMASMLYTYLIFTSICIHLYTHTHAYIYL